LKRSLLGNANLEKGDVRYYQLFSGNKTLNLLYCPNGVVRVGTLVNGTVRSKSKCGNIYSSSSLAVIRIRILVHAVVRSKNK